MRRRFVENRVPDIKPAEPSAPIDEKPIEGEKDEPKVKKPSGFQKGTANPKYSTGAMSSEIELSQEAFAAMKEQEQLYCDEIDKMAEERSWSRLKVSQIKSQAARVARLNAILKSNYGRMQTETRYRRKVQEPTTSESIIRYEAQAQRQEALLYQLMGMDEMHEAKVQAAESKSKPTDFQVLIGGNLSKKQMAAGGDGDDD